MIQHPYGYGFYGIRGFFGVAIGLVLLCVFVWGLWAIFDILSKKFSNENTGWMFQILRIILIVLTVFWFVNRIFNLVIW
jgi:hypothetical protein